MLGLTQYNSRRKKGPLGCSRLKNISCQFTLFWCYVGTMVLILNFLPKQNSHRNTWTPRGFRSHLPLKKRSVFHLVTSSQNVQALSTTGCQIKWIPLSKALLMYFFNRCPQIPNASQVETGDCVIHQDAMSCGDFLNDYFQAEYYQLGLSIFAILKNPLKNLIQYVYLRNNLIVFLKST